METFGLYLIKSAAWTTAFLIVYFLFLRNERYFTLKRIYLLAGLAISFLFPLITFHYKVERSFVPISETAIIPAAAPANHYLRVEGASALNAPFLITIIYLAGIILLLGFMTVNLIKIKKRIDRSVIRKYGSVKIIRIPDFRASFSFFNYVIVNPLADENELLEILNHELVHVKQKHWLDLLFAGLLRLLQWANPFAWIYTGYIRLNHEHLADEIALRRSMDPAVYKAALLNQIMDAPVFSLSSFFNMSNTRKRFEMMKQKFTSPYRKLKVLIILPLFAVVFYAFSLPEYVYSPVNATLIIGKPDIIIQNKLTGTVYNENNQPLKGVNVIMTYESGNLATSETTTDENGYFLFDLSSQERVLLTFVCKGYKSLSLKPELNTPLTIRMKSDDQGVKKPASAVDGVITGKNYSEIINELGHNFGFARLIKGKEATDKYGEKGVNGVIEITTRKKALEEGIKVPYPRLGPEDKPHFPGPVSFTQWVIDRVKYPPEAKEERIEGLVNVDFTVELDGTISNITPSAEANPVLNDAVVNVIKSSPKWESPKNPEVDEPYRTNIMIRFSLPDNILAPEEPFVVVEEMPSYPGGDAALLKFLSENTHYPEIAKAEKISGKVIVRFIVSVDGKAEGISVLKGVHPLLDEEAIRVVSLLHGFKPGLQGGVPVPVWYMVPISFILPPDSADSTNKK